MTVIDDGVLGQLLLAYCRDTSSARALTRLLSVVPAPQVAEAVTDLVEPGEPIAAQQVRRSNAYAVAATLRARGFGRVGDDHVPDDEAMLRELLKLMIGSVGSVDHVRCAGRGEGTCEWRADWKTFDATA